MGTKFNKVGFLADTHSAKNDGSDLPDSVLKAFKGVDLIVHLGDVGKKMILNRLGEVAPVMIQSEDRKGYTYAATPSAPVKAIESNGHSVGLTVNLAQPDKKIEVHEDWIGVQGDLSKLLDRRFKQSVDVVAFAATHVPSTFTMEGVLFFNPGSPTLPMEPPGTVSILDLSKKAASVRMVRL